MKEELDGLVNEIAWGYSEDRQEFLDNREELVDTLITQSKLKGRVSLAQFMFDNGVYCEVDKIVEISGECRRICEEEKRVYSAFSEYRDTPLYLFPIDIIRKVFDRIIN